MDESAIVTFIEADGPAAAASLREARSRLGGGGSSELLRSTERPDLWLLVVRGRVATADVPAGARTWRFAAEAPT